MSAGVPQRPCGVRFSTLLVQALHLLARALGQIGIDPARQHRVDLDVVLRPGGRHRPGHLHDAAFAGGVRRGIGRAEQRHHRPDIDHLAAAGLHHRGIRRLRQQECAGQVGIQHVVPLFLGIVLRHLADRGAGIVHQDVEPAEFRLRRRDQRHAVGLFVTSAAMKLAFARRCAQRCQRGRRLLLIAAGDHDAGAARGDALRHAKPDAAVAAGDDRDLPLRSNSFIGLLSR